MKKGVLWSLGIIWIGLLLFSFYILNLKNDSSIKDISEVITREYKSGIDPTKYDNIWDFLNDSGLFSQDFIDLFQEDFVICLKQDDGGMLYIPFDQADIQNNYFAGNKKNLAIDDIYLAFKNKCILGGWKSNATEKILFEKDVAHEESYILNKVFSDNLNIHDAISELESVENSTVWKTELLSYLYDLKWNYSKANDKRDGLCKQEKSLCEKDKKMTFYGKVVDQNGQGLENIDIELLNDQSISSKTDKDWNYKLVFEFYPFSHLRLKASAKWFSDWFQTISYNTYKDPQWIKEEERNFTLRKYDANYIIDSKTSNHEIEKDGKTFYEFKSKQSKYFVPKDGLVNKDLKKWQGKKVWVYLYEFTKWDNVDNLTNVDSFSAVSWYVWNLMKTFGMPYIQFIDLDSGEELFVAKSNPMILQNTIYHMKELYENYDKIYEPITDEDMQFLVDQSLKNEWYPINYKFLIENDMLRWPAWWSLDREKGIWENVGMKVLSVDGLVELPYYSINK